MQNKDFDITKMAILAFSNKKQKIDLDRPILGNMLEFECKHFYKMFKNAQAFISQLPKTAIITVREFTGKH